MDFKSKVQCLLQYMHDSSGGDYMEFRFVSTSGHSICHATNAIEFEEILDFAQENRWLKWRKRDPMSGGRMLYHGVQLTHQGMEKIIQESPMMFAGFPACPLTGLPLKGQATFTPLNGSAQVLYAFKPIGQAIFERDRLIGLGKAIAADNQRLHPDLAGLCREAMERRQPAIKITYAMLAGPETEIVGPRTFEEKQAHLLRLLYDTGSKEYKERDLYINDDFTLAFAENAEEFTRILKALITKGLLQYDKPNDTLNDWPYGIRTEYYGVLLTPLGEQSLITSLVHRSTSMATPQPDSSVDKIFISHSSKDSAIVEEVIDLLEIIGVGQKQIFCSSFPGYGIELGQDFLQRIKDELNGNVLVIFILTDNFYSSPVSLCEMGAAWVKTRQHIPIVVPPLSYEDVKGVIPLTQGFKVNEPLKWNLLKEQIEGLFTLKHPASASAWERKRDKAIQVIDKKIAEGITLAAEQAAAKTKQRPRRGGSSTTLIQ